MKHLLLALAMFFALAGIAIATVNINTATKEELMTVKGIGEKRAQDIIEYRTKHGNFKSVDELEKVPGIGPSLMKQIRSEVAVTGKTTVTTDTKSKGAEPVKAKTTDAKKSETAKSETTKAEKAKKTAKANEKSKAEKK